MCWVLNMPGTYNACIITVAAMIPLVLAIPFLVSPVPGFDMSEPTAHNQGKPQAIARLRQKYPYNSVVMIGGKATWYMQVHAPPWQNLLLCKAQQAWDAAAAALPQGCPQWQCMGEDLLPALLALLSLAPLQMASLTWKPCRWERGVWEGWGQASV
jgi:hypothetical protein